MGPWTEVAALLVALGGVGAPGTLGAQDTRGDSLGGVQGTVRDAASGAPVPAATVRVDGTRLGTLADDAGRYRLPGVPAGTVTVVVQRVGYEGERRTVTVRAGVTTTLDVALRAATTALATVRVAADPRDREEFRRAPGPGILTVTRDAFTRVPVIGEPDVLRVVQLLPGVVAPNDFTAGYNVRGGESDQNLILLDGYPLYNPFHLGGLFGTFIDETVGGFELLPGVFPARHGTRLSSVLDVTPRVEERSGVHGSAAVSVLASSLTLAGTARGRTSWSVSARRTYADRFVALLSDNQLPYWFTDVQAHLRHRLAGGGTLSATLYTGSDILAASLATFGDSSRAGAGALRFDWGNTLLGAAYTQPLRALAGGDSAALMQRVSRTGFGTGLNLGSGSLTFDNQLSEWRAWGEATRWQGIGETRAGYEWSAYRTTYRVAAPAAAAEPFLDETSAPSALSLYADHTVRWPRLAARAGVRGETVTGTDWAGLSPRLSLKWFASPALAVTAAAGATSQWTPAFRNEQAPVRLFDFWLTANRTTPVARAWQQSLGAERWVGRSRFVRLEGWHKRYTRLPATNLANDPNRRGDEFIITTGRSYGADLLLRQLESERLAGWLAYSYGVSVRDGPAGRFAPVQDRRHNLNLVASYQASPRYRVGMRLGLGTGTPFTDIVGQVVRRRYDPISNSFELGALETNREPVGGPRNGARFPLFQRLDVSLTREGQGRLRWAPYLSLINAYNARNVFTYIFDFEDNPPTRTAFSQFPLLPTAGVSLSW
jgi:hypothetical protein